MSVADSTDWLPTPLAGLAPLDSALRCHVCKDFFTTPMITSCSHTFCSICIRRSLSHDGRCPACRELDQEIKLRRNWAVEELVTTFGESRRKLLDYAHAAAERQQDEVEAERPKKRRKMVSQTAAPVERRSTRSQSRRNIQASQSSVQSSPEELVEDSEEGSVYEDESSIPDLTASAQPPSTDGLVACPSCGKRMKEEAVFVHLDTCTGESEAVSMPSAPAHSVQAGSIAYSRLSPTTQRDRLPTINYALYSEAQLRKKMKELGIPNTGSKLLLQRRHTEWLNLWNANCDSRHPGSKSELLRDLNTWERTQGRQIANNAGPSGVMVKDFDRNSYARAHKSDFENLIEQARVKAKAARGVPVDGRQESSQSEPCNSSTQIGGLFGPSLKPVDHDEDPEPQSVSARPNGSQMLQVVPESPDKNTLVDLTSPEAPNLDPSRSQGSAINV